MNTDMSINLMTTETTGTRDMSAEQLSIFQVVGKIMYETRYYDLATPARATFLMAKAYELGFPATSALDVIDDIKGRLTLKPVAALALVFRSGLLEDMQVEDGDDFCEVQFKRKGFPFMLGYKFTLSDAQKADLYRADKPDSAWSKWTKNMLYWRAVGFAIDRVFPDVTIGLKDSIQFGAPAPDGRVNPATGEITVINAEQED